MQILMDRDDVLECCGALNESAQRYREMAATVSAPEGSKLVWTQTADNLNALCIRMLNQMMPGNSAGMTGKGHPNADAHPG